MATLRHGISLNDGMSPVLKQMQQSLSSTISCMEDMSNSMKSDFDTSRIEFTRYQINDLGAQIAIAEKQQNSFNQSFNDGKPQVSSFFQTAYFGIELLKKGYNAIKGLINTADTFSTTYSRINLMNDGLQTTEELNNKIFASAQRTRESYQDTADMITRIKSSTGNLFKNNDSVIQFTETFQQSSVVSGASNADKERAMLQMQQALARGKLQGQELNTLMETSPRFIQAIAEELNVPIMKVRQLASEGKITSEVMTNAMFHSAQKINEEFQAMPDTWGDMMTKTKNAILKGFQPVIQKFSEFVNGESFYNFLNMMTIIFSLVANSAGNLLEFLTFVFDGLNYLMTNFGDEMMAGLITTLTIYAFQTIPKVIAQNYALAQSWLIAHWPLLLIVATVMLIMFVLNKLGVSFADVIGFIAGTLGFFYASFHNSVAFIWNIWSAFIEFFANAFRDPVTAIKMLWLNLADTIYSVIEQLAKATTWLVNLIPGVEVSWADGITNMRQELARLKDDLKDSEYWEAPKMEMKNLGDTASAWSNKAKGLIGNLGDLSLFDMDSKIDLDNVGINGGYLDEIKGDVNISDEDIKLLKDIASQEFILNLKHITPNVTANFGDVKETADVEQIMKVIEDMIEDASASDLITD